MRRNRRIRDTIESHLGVSAIEEVERWNDCTLDSLAEWGVELSPQEEALQAQVFEVMATEERILLEQRVV